MPGYGTDHTMEARNLLQQLSDAARKVQEVTTEASKATELTVKNAFNVIVTEYQSRVDDIKTKLIASITAIAQPPQ
jgi:hypothetical protein